MKVATKKPKTLDKTKSKKNAIKKKKQLDTPKVSKVAKKVVDTPKVSKAAKKAVKPKSASAAAGKDEKQPKKKAKKTHKQDLEGLKDLDPEFYDFLKKNDKELLEFNLLDTDDEDEEDAATEEKEAVDDADDDDDEDNEAKFHKPSDDLAVASDESDFEGEDDEEVSAGGVQKVTLNLLRQWELQLGKPNVSIETVRQVIQAFNSALASISADGVEGENANATAYKVVGAAAFNGVIQLCVLHLQPAIIRVLGVKPNSSLPLHKHKKWVKVRGCLRYYLTDLIRLVEQVSSSNILNVLLKHLHQMAGMVAPFTALGKTILKRLIVLWATGDETVRVLSFLCILKITRKQQVS